MKHTLSTLYCPECGGTHVQIMAWVDANTNEYCSDVNTPAEMEDTWCDDCEGHTGLATLPELWEMFSEIPIDNDDEIEEPFLCFPAGTPRLEVWRWFDARCPNSLSKDLLNGQE